MLLGHEPQHQQHGSGMNRSLGRSPTFLVGTERQKINLSQLHRNDQHLNESYQKHKPLCFNAGAYQQTHPAKVAEGHIDADVTLTSPMLLGVADGVSQIADYGLDPSELPSELLKACGEAGYAKLMPDDAMKVPEGGYAGPVHLLRDAFEETQAMGSTTALLCILDNSSVIHSQLHPMIAVVSVGDCEVMVLRFKHDEDSYGGSGRLEPVFNSEMQRIEGNAQCPLQICRLDETIDPHWDESMSVEVIDRGASVHCMTCYEGDIVVLGSDGVFDNLFRHEIVDILRQFYPHQPSVASFAPTEKALLREIARTIVEACHAKTRRDHYGRYPETPIGKGGKRDDTCCVVGEVIEWTDTANKLWARTQRQRRWRSLFSCGVGFQEDSSIEFIMHGLGGRELPHAGGSAVSNNNSEEDDSEDYSESNSRCCVS